MSWLTDLAGKAEDFLVKIDKNAAVAAQTVLVTKDHVNLNQSRRDSGASVVSDFLTNHEQQTRAVAVNFKSSISMSDLSKAAKTKPDLDANLMASLNTNSNALVTPTNATSATSNTYPNCELSLVQENNLLKQEIKSLNQEIRQSMQHAKQAQKEAKHAEQQLKTQTSAIQSVEQQWSSLRKENMALADKILDKDAELSTLKGKIEIAHVEQEHQTKQEHIQPKLEHIQTQLEVELQKRQCLEIQIKLQQSQMEKDRGFLLAESKQYQHQLQAAKEELEVVRQSLDEYKLRAQRILQDKDRLLQDIKQQKSVESFQLPSESLMAELDQLQQERDLLREETVQSNAQLQQSRKEIACLETRYEDEIRQIREISSHAETRMLDERVKKELVENELRQLDEELRYVREDLSQQKIQSVGRIQQLEMELSKAKNQLTSKQNNSSTPTQDELEQRLRTLTETLVAKQVVLEKVQSERSSLLLQLERVMKERTSNGTKSDNETSARVLLNITDDELAKVTTGVSRRMRRAYSSLDSLNFRFGQALRRRPAARLVLLFYMVVLHFWVAFVLLTYTPEMHESNHSTSP